MGSSKTETNIGVIGLGTMGSTLAHSFLDANHKLMVWNRSKEKSFPLSKRGACVANSVENVIEKTSLIIMCLSNKAACEALLRKLADGINVKDKVIVNMSTGSESEAEAISKMVEDAGGYYLDGGILSYPRDIGKATTCILYSGNEKAYQDNKSILAALAGSSMYLGKDPRKCTQLYFPFYVFYFGCLSAWMEGANLASASNISLTEFSSLLPVITDMLSGGISDSVERINAGNFAGDQASVDVHLDGQLQIQEACKLANIPHVVTDSFIHYCKLAQDQGLGDQDIASLLIAMANK